MKRTIWPFMFVLAMMLVLSACGQKSQEDVTASLEEKMDDIKSYKAKAKMILETGKQPQEYDIEIWYKKPSYYRVLLENPTKDQSQMILRNDEGVFVLTPALNKSFRFQSDWPDNSSQPYLYESIVRDILMDDAAAFQAAEDSYVFETKTNYQNNKTLPRQKITLTKKSLAPTEIKVLDQDGKTRVKVLFSKFEWDTKFEKNDFNMERNMTSSQLEMTTMADADEKPMAVLYPTENLEGMELVEQAEMKTKEGERVVMTFDGEKSFTLIQEKAKADEAVKPVTVSGDPVDLGFTVGAMSDSSIQWTYNGVDFYLVSNDLSEEEMVNIARSVQGQAIK